MGAPAGSDSSGCLRRSTSAATSFLADMMELREPSDILDEEVRDEELRANSTWRLGLGGSKGGMTSGSSSRALATAEEGGAQMAEL